MKILENFDIFKRKWKCQVKLSLFICQFKTFYEKSLAKIWLKFG